MEIKLSFLTGKIYVVGSMGKQDVTDDCINAVLIRLLEGHKDNIAVIKKSDGKKYELKAVEIEGGGIERIEAQSSVIIACQNAILQKDERIAELEATIEKMKCCENCSFYPPQKCRFDTQYGCLDGLIPTNWKIKGTNNE